MASSVVGSEAASEPSVVAASEDAKKKKIRFVFHYGGSWSHSWENEEEQEMEYIGGEAEVVDNPNMDKMGFFYLAAYAEQLGFNWGCRMWYRLGRVVGKEGFEEIKNDGDVADMLFLNSEQRDIHLYYIPIPPPTAIVDRQGVLTEMREFEDDDEVDILGVSGNEEHLQTNKEAANVCLALVPYVRVDEVPREEENQEDVRADEVGREEENQQDVRNEVFREEEIQVDDLDAEFDFDWYENTPVEQEKAGSDNPEADQGIAVDETPEVDKGKAFDEIPAVDKGKAVDETPAVDKGKAVDETPAVDKGKAVDENPPVQQYNNQFDFDWGDYGVSDENSGGSMFSSGCDDSSDENYVYSEGDTESEELEVPEGFIYDEEDLAHSNVPPVRGEDDLHSPVHSEEENLQQRVDYDERTGDLSLGMVFGSPKAFRQAFRKWSIERGYCHTVQKNESALITYVCKRKCGFRIRVTRLRDSSSMEIKTLYPHVNCGRSMKNSMVKSDFLAFKYLNDFKECPEMKVGSLVQKVHRELQVDIHPVMAYRAKVKALNMIKGEESAQYRRLWDWGVIVMKTNPGSKVFIKTNVELFQDEDDGSGIPSMPRELVVFKYMYVRFAPMKIGYTQGVRPFICLDGCHLKTFMGGHLLSAVAKDGNNQLFPIALACVDSECKDSWKWFIETMFEDYGHPDQTGWVFMSDQQKGLIEALKEIAPDMEHRFCVKHMYENMKKIFKGEEYRKKLWAAACAGTKRYFSNLMEDYAKFDKNAAHWIMGHDPHTWARCYFSEHTKCDAVQNNSSESWNAEILEARKEPVLSMFEWIRKHLMEQHYEKYCKMEKYRGPICPNIQLQLENEKIESRNWFCTPAGTAKYEVHCGAVQKDVNLLAKTCSCRLWQLSGIPCKHAISAIYVNREEPEIYVDECYLKSTYMAVYKHMYNPVPSQEEWERTPYPDIYPWEVKRAPGRPKKLRQRVADEPRNPYKSSRQGIKGRCGRCKAEGHNVRSCKANITGETAWQARKRKSAQRGSSQSNAGSSRTRSSRIRAQGSQPILSTHSAIHSGQPRAQTSNPIHFAVSPNNMNQGNVPAGPSTTVVPSTTAVPSTNVEPIATAVPSGRGRQRSRRNANPQSFRAPRPRQVPSYAAETVAAAAKRKRPNQQDVQTPYNNPSRAQALKELAKRRRNLK